MRGPSFRYIITNCLLCGLAVGFLTLFYVMLRDGYVYGVEPIQAILVGEFVAMCLIIVLGMVNLIDYIGRYWNDKGKL